MNKSLVNEWKRQFTMERPGKVPRTEDPIKQEMVEFLDQYQPDISSKIEESLQTLEYEVACIKQNLEVKKRKITLAQIDQKVQQILDMVSMMHDKMERILHN